MIDRGVIYGYYVNMMLQKRSQMLNRRNAFRRKRKLNKARVVPVFVILSIVTCIILFSTATLSTKIKELDERQAQLEQLIAEQDEYTQELAELKKYTKTKKFAEDMAKQKLGLVYADEIVFKPEDSQ